MVGKLKEKSVEGYMDPPPKFVKLASVVAVLIFELEYGQTKHIGSDFYTQFISANLGSLVSQGLLNGDRKVRYFGCIENPPSLILTGPSQSVNRLTESWKNRLLKAPQGTKLLSFGLLNNFGMDSIVQRQNIRLADLVLMAIADLNSLKLIAQPSTIHQHLESKCEEMNIPHMKAIEYCISELVKSKKVNFHSNGGYKLEMKSIPNHSEVVKSPIPQSPPPPVSQSKTPQKSKRKTFSFDFTRKLKNSLRRRTMSPAQQQQTNQRLTSSPTSPANQLQPVNTQQPTQKVNIPDSGIDHSLPSTKSQNPSMTSTASQVTTPNWSDQNTSQNEQNNQKPATTTNTTSFESPLRLQQRTSSPVAPLPSSAPAATQRGRGHLRDFSDAESVSSSIRGGKVMKRRPSRRRSKNTKSPNPAPVQAETSTTTPLAPRRKSKSNLNETSPFKQNRRSHLDEDNEVDNIFNGSDSLQRRFIRSSDKFDFPPPPTHLSPTSEQLKQHKPVHDDDSIFGEDSEHVDDTPAQSQIQRTNSITFNIRQGNKSDSLTFEQINSPPINRRDLMPPSSERQRSKTPLSIFDMKDQLQSHINRQRSRPNSCHPSMMHSPPSSRQRPEEDMRYSAMWNKPKQNQLSPKFKSPTLVKTNFTPPHSPTKEKNRSPSERVLRSKTPAPRPAPRQNMRERPKSVNPDRMLLSPNSRTKAQPLKSKHALSLEVLEQLSLTRDEWIEYFKTKQTPERLTNEISRLSPVSKSVDCLRDETASPSPPPRPTPKPRAPSASMAYDWPPHKSASDWPVNDSTGDTRLTEAYIVRQILDELEIAKTKLEHFLPNLNQAQNQEEESHTEDSGINSPKNRTSPMFKFTRNDCVKPLHWTNV